MIIQNGLTAKDYLFDQVHEQYFYFGDICGNQHGLISAP